MIVTVLVAVAFEQPPVPVTVYVIVAVPAATPVTTPEEFTVATAVLLDVQAPPETVEEKVVVEPTQILCVPERVPAEVPFEASKIVAVPVTTDGLEVELGVPVNEPIAFPKAKENNLSDEDPVYPKRNSKSCIGSA